MEDRELRDRLIALERDVHNYSNNHMKLEQKVDLLSESLNEKIDMLLEKVTAMNATMARWLGAATVLVFIVQVAIEKFL